MNHSQITTGGTMSAGLLVDGQLIPLRDLTVIPPANHGGPAWNTLHPDDYAARTAPVQILTLHTTGGHWPQPILPSAGPPGHARQVLEMWAGVDHGGGERVHSGAPIVVDFDGTIYCAADVVRTAAYHAQLINARSVGIEMCTTPEGGLYQATIDATARLVALLTWSGLDGAGVLSIPAQMPRGPYRGSPLRRLEIAGRQTDGRDLVGVIGHRDQTAQRGRGDPGDTIWTALAGLGFEGVDYDGSEDLELGRARQAVLVARGERIGVDGLVGPASLAAARRQGFARWRDVPVTGL
jgi:hypothetical protein